jgi:hypothetical protein
MDSHSSRFESDAMSLDELAGRLGLGMTAARERARLDALPVPRIPGTGRRYLYSRRAFEALLLAQHPLPGGREALPVRDDRAA